MSARTKRELHWLTRSLPDHTEFLKTSASVSCLSIVFISQSQLPSAHVRKSCQRTGIK